MQMLRSKWKYGFVLVLFFSGCGPAPLNAPATLPACTLPASDINPYRSPPSTTTAYDIFQTPQALQTQQPSGSIQPALPPSGGILSIEQMMLLLTPSSGAGLPTLPTTKQTAFLLFEDQVRGWSDYADVLVDDTLVLRITITYISPQLIESLVLNQILYTGAPVADFQAQVRRVNDSIAVREENLFLVILTASEYHVKLLPNDALVVDLPVSEMKLTNSSGLTVSPYHKDNHLEYPINLRLEPEHGYLAYPLAVGVDKDCNWLFDPTWNTTVTIHVPSLQVNQKPYGPLTWSIDYHPLVGINALSPTATPSVPFVESDYKPVPEAPPPVNGEPKSNAVYWDDYWQKMTRYIWYHLTETSHH
jgi:hypothetical protein